MIALSVYFKSTTPKQQMDIALQECNKVLLEDFGPSHEFEPNDAPDLLLIGRDTSFEGRYAAVGLLTLDHTEVSRAWELGTMSAKKAYSHGKLFAFFMQCVPGIILNTMQGDNVAPAWIVKRVAQSNKRHINLLKTMGFVEPAHFMIGVLSNEGYIPFDPFDEVLMKLRICPPESETKKVEQASDSD